MSRICFHLASFPMTTIPVQFLKGFFFQNRPKLRQLMSDISQNVIVVWMVSARHIFRSFGPKISTCTIMEKSPDFQFFSCTRKAKFEVVQQILHKMFKKSKSNSHDFSWTNPYASINNLNFWLPNQRIKIKNHDHSPYVKNYWSDEGKVFLIQ